jgi:transcriptional regulator with XRE-family HTH domain
MNAIHTVAVCSAQDIYTGLGIPTLRCGAQSITMRYFERIADLRKQRGLSQAQLAERLAVEQPTVQRWEAGTRKPSVEALEDTARVLGVPVSSFFIEDAVTPLGPSLYVKGEVAAGVWRHAVEWPEDDWQSFTGRPDVKAEVQHRFGLRVTGDSMNLLYPPGTIVECVSVFGHIEAAPGKRVVVIREDENHQFEATIKELVEDGGELWLVPRSTNPAHRPIQLSQPEPGILETRVAAVIVASYRPE